MNLPYMVNRIEIAFWTVLVSALQDRRSPGRLKAVLLAVFAATVMLLALVWARLPSRPAISSASAQAVAPLARPSNGQNNLLIVVVDRLDSRQPRLQSVWVVGRLPALPQVAFLPIYPSRPAATAEAYSGEVVVADAGLPVVFALNEAGGLPEDFAAALRQRSLWWDHHIVMDMRALARLVDLLGGVELDGVWVDGRDAAALALDFTDGQTAWNFHLQMAQQVCAQAARLSRKSAAETSEEFAKFVVSDLPPERLQAVLRGLQAGGTVCNFPTASGR